MMIQEIPRIENVVTLITEVENDFSADCVIEM